MAKVAILPGNGCYDIFAANWYGWAFKKLSKLEGIECICHTMPDPLYCRQNIWIPHIRDEMKLDETSIIIGHSSGAVAAMRYAEQYKIRGIIIVSTYTSHLGDETEKASGYFDEPWNWEKIRENCGFIVQFGSTDDPLVPWEEQEVVAKELKSDLKKFSDKGHFMNSTFPELIKVVEQCLKK